MASYSFKTQNKEVIEAIDRWQENGYTIRNMVEYLILKYEGLELPKPNEVQLISIELNRQREEIEKLKKDSSEMVEILIPVIADVDFLNALHPRPLPMTNSPSVKEY